MLAVPAQHAEALRADPEVTRWRTGEGPDFVAKGGVAGREPLDDADRARIADVDVPRAASRADPDPLRAVADDVEEALTRGRRHDGRRGLTVSDRAEELAPGHPDATGGVFVQGVDEGVDARDRGEACAVAAEQAKAPRDPEAAVPVFQHFPDVGGRDLRRGDAAKDAALADHQTTRRSDPETSGRVDRQAVDRACGERRDLLRRIEPERQSVVANDPAPRPEPEVAVGGLGDRVDLRVGEAVVAVDDPADVGRRRQRA